MSRTREYKGKISYLIFCRSSVSFDNLKYSVKHAINWFLKLNRSYFSHASNIAFLSSEIDGFCRTHS